MNADVEKAVALVTDHIADLNRCIGVFHAYPQMKATAAEFAKATKELAPVVKALRDHEAEIARLRGLLGQCYALSGADTDGDTPARHADAAVSAVAELRKDYDEVLDWQDRAEKAESLLRECLAELGGTFLSSESDLLAQRIIAHLGGEQ